MKSGKYATADNSLFLVAEDDGNIVVVLMCKGGECKSRRHSTMLGKSVNKPLRGKGIDALLTEHAVQWAKNSDIVKRVELQVFERNSSPIKLYKKFGFEVEGKQRKATYREGEYHDVLVMARLS